MSVRTDEREIKYRFGKYGEIENVTLIWNRETNTSRGFGFITYKELDGAIEAVEAMNGQEIDGREVRVDFSFTKRGHDNSGGRGGGGGGGGRRRSRSRSRDRRRRSRSRDDGRRRGGDRRRSRSRSNDRRRR